MLGLTFEKLFVVALCATVILGPTQLPVYSRKIVEFIRTLRRFVESAKAQAENDMGVPLNRADWSTMNLRQYDPRTIMREGLESPITSVPDTTSTGPSSNADIPAPPGKWVIQGDAAHPRRVFVDSAESRV